MTKELKSPELLEAQNRPSASRIFIVAARRG
ncbi:hypothetical protein PENNAL_c0573G11922 [Penicillium nalgiovense]|uniref:Uncharacterized protein n=1 Tax=Penicillium nalgiovense TaxID=60175 RepID=A0A1V6VBU9_PENNA|nr:hypothetical protein PENNAL_c0573G11922 [Penicillium nalgiovense]